MIMSFNGKVILNSGYSLIGDNLTWELDLTFSDFEGLYASTSVMIGDLILFDTASYDTGSVALYKITQVVSTSPSLICRVELVETNPINPADLNYSFGSEGLIYRRNSNNLGDIPSFGVQSLSERLYTYARNIDLHNISLGGGAEQEIRLGTYTSTLAEAITNATRVPTGWTLDYGGGTAVTASGLGTVGASDLVVQTNASKYVSDIKLVHYNNSGPSETQGFIVQHVDPTSLNFRTNLTGTQFVFKNILSMMVPSRATYLTVKLVDIA